MSLYGAVYIASSFRISIRLSTTAGAAVAVFLSLTLTVRNLHLKVSNAYSILGIIKRNLTYLDKDSFLLLYKAIVRPHLEHANSVVPIEKGDVHLIEKVQKRATKLIISLKHLP